MIPPTSQGSDRLRRYFSRYPERKSGGLGRLVRKGEEARYKVISSWIPSTVGRTILDIGCGDGVFLSHVLRGRPACLRLEDIADRWPPVAHRQLNGLADDVSCATVDSRYAQDANRYDIVFALGVSDYDQDWTGLVNCLIRRADQLLITDFPKSGTWHSILRRLWLSLHGIQLHTADRAEMASLIDAITADAECVELPLQWVVRFRVRRVMT